MSPRGFETLRDKSAKHRQASPDSAHLASKFLFMFTFVTVERRRPPAAVAKLPFSAILVFGTVRARMEKARAQMIETEVGKCQA